ncbi:hypothetical protein THRCLA_22341 [Thraustotheca clavata]|uniref:Uncharacterized protein n=1 Tax=Thraustotheca clavata TaxID=74557 RepID=A0A1V9Z594_9STRA|nr:hypothetical protein THRCLA_22341 [Thraustotheca clavata]
MARITAIRGMTEFLRIGVPRMLMILFERCSFDLIVVLSVMAFDLGKYYLYFSIITFFGIKIIALNVATVVIAHQLPQTVNQITQDILLGYSLQRVGAMINFVSYIVVGLYQYFLSTLKNFICPSLLVLT